MVPNAEEKYNSNPEKSTYDLKQFGLEDERPYQFSFCGKTWTPGFLQFMNKLEVLAFFIFSMCVFQGAIVNGLVNISITTLEQYFGFESWMTGLMAVSYDIGFILIAMYVTFVLARKNIPRVIACGYVLMGLGAITFSLPHFLTGTYSGGQTVGDTCPQTEECDENNSVNMQAWIAVFIIAQMMHGFGATPLYTLGFSFLESSSTKDNGAMLFAVALTGSCIGPAFGFVGGAYQLMFWVEGEDNKPDGITSSDPGWVGAWWMGFVVCGMGCILCALPMFGFPKQFPGTAIIKAEKESETVGELVNEDYSFYEGVRSLITNKVFFFASIGSAMDGYLSSGLMTFGPKLIEERFHQTAGAAAFTAGLVCVPGAVFGSFVGGLIAKIFKLTGRGMMWLSTTSAVITLTLYIVSMQITCGDKEFVGINQPYNNLDNSCNLGCNCSTAVFEPLCINERTYFSPCYAGCETKINETHFTNCRCLESSDIGYVGECEDDESDDCFKSQIIFMVLCFFVVFFEFLPPTVVPIATLRAVDPKLKSLSMGLQWNLLRIIGTIPGPIILGFMLDGACTVWQYVCGEKASCWVYDDNDIKKAVLIIPSVTKVINILCFFLAGWYSKKMITVEEDRQSLANDKLKEASL